MAVPERDCSIIFSVNSINLHSDIGGPKSRVYTYFVLNKGTSSKRIRVTTSKESDAVFKISKGSDVCLVPAGISMPVVLSYTSDNNCQHHGEIEVFVGEKLNNVIPILVSPPYTCLETGTNRIDFGIQINEHQIISKCFEITNSGNLEGSYTLQSNVASHLIVTPSRGIVGPNQSQTISVELLCNFVGKVSECLRFDVDSKDHTSLSVDVICTIVKRTLEILDPCDMKLRLNKLSFKNVYYGSVVSQQIILFNNSPVSSDYISILDDSMSECVNMSESLAVGYTKSRICGDKQRSPDLNSLFDVSPKKGTLNPYEKLIVNLKFAPRLFDNEKGWENCLVPSTQRDYNVIIKFILVNLSSSYMDIGFTMITLSACARPVLINVIPETTINFYSCSTGSRATKVIEIVNLSDSLPVKFKTQKLAHYNCYPSVGVINMGESTNIEIIFQPKQLGPLNFQLPIHFWGPDSKSFRLDAIIHSKIIHLRGFGASVAGSEKLLQKVCFAKVDDLMSSIRPWSDDANRKIVTPFTNIPRYTYVDLDYSNDQEQSKLKSANKHLYVAYLRKKRSERLWSQKEKQLSCSNTFVDLNMPPSSGLESPTVIESKGYQCTTIPVINHIRHKMTTPADVLKSISMNLEFCEICPEVVDTKLSSDYKNTLQPDELSLIVVEPSSLNFGHIVCDSTVQKDVFIKNYTSQHISIKFEMCGSQIRCVKYPDKSEVLVFLQPQSYMKLQFVMVQFKSGNIEGSLKYEINDRHVFSIPVYAVVKELSLQLSSNVINLCEQTFAHINAGFWGEVEVNNPHDIPIAFKWCPMNEVDCNVFFAMHSSGVVPSNKNMKCGFVYLPSFDSPSSAEYELYVGNVDQQENFKNFTVLHLNAEFQKATCVLQRRRILFGTIPLNLVSSQALCIENKGCCHAYYKVSDLTNNCIVEVSPAVGCIPSGGMMELLINVHPVNVGSFDIKICINIKESRSLYVRITGIAEEPRISVEKEVFNFGGVLCGSKASMPYVITNQGLCRVELKFDFTYLRDFTLLLPENHKSRKTEESDQIVLELPTRSSAMCALEFRPHEVAAYDFFLTVLVNGLKPPSPPASPWPPSNTYSSLCLTDDFNVSFSKTPTRRVIATALQSPLLLSTSEINFSLCPVQLPFNESLVHDKSITLMNISSRPLTWALDLSCLDHINDGTFQLVHSSSADFLTPPQPGNPSSLDPGESCALKLILSPDCYKSFDVTVPLLLNGNSVPYSELLLSVTLPIRAITINPKHIIMQTVPLGISYNTEFFVEFDGFLRPVALEVAVPTFEKCVHFEITFPDVSKISNCKKSKIEIPCVLEFSSTQQVSKTVLVTFIESNSGVRSEVPFTVSADNSMFSVCEYFSQNLDATIIKPNEDNTPVLYLRENRESNVTTSLSINYNQSSASVFDYKQMYFQDCVSAICRWISVYGGSCIKYLKSPTDMRVKVKEDISISGQKQRSSIRVSRGILVDMLTHLCGRIPPGIPVNLPPCTNLTEKVIQQYSTYDIVLSFLKNQGGILPGLDPELLLDYHSYMHWITGIKKESYGSMCPKDEVEFSKMSNQAWTCILMQTIKVLVLPRLLKAESPHFHDVAIKMKSVTNFVSNIYSVSERSLLLWLNYHYNLQKDILFNSGSLLNDIINFDVDLMDGTVLACVLYSYFPFMKNSHFARLYNNPSTPEQCAHNAIIILSALKYVGINYDVQQSDLCSPNPIFMILFCAHLFCVLPAYEPSDIIKFSADLGATDEVKITVHNRNVKSVDYSVLIRGENPKSFTAEKSLTVLGRSSTELTVDYHCSSIHSSNANIYLVAQGRQPTLSTVSYSLFGSTIGAKTMIRKKIVSSLYEVTTTYIYVNSPFEVEGEFEIGLFETENNDLLSLHITKSERQKRLKPPKYISWTYLQKQSDDGINLFHCKDKYIKLVPGASNMIAVIFVPLKLNPRHCSIVLFNSELGDIVLSISALVNHPIPLLPNTLHRHHHTVVNPETRTLHLNTVANSNVIEDIVLKSLNLAFEDALLEISKWKLNEHELNHRLLTGSLRYAALSSGISHLCLDDCVNFSNIGSEEFIVFTVEGSDNEHFILPKEVKVPTNVKGSAVIPIRFHADKEGQYECHIQLKSGHDMRIIVIESTVLAEGKLAQIEFKTQAIQPLTQNIPVVNPSTSDWPLNAIISSPLFNGPSNFIANALSTSCYPLTFFPQREGNIMGELKLINSKDSSEHIFKLFGVAERPLAQDCIKLHSTVKHRMTHIIHVVNLKDKTTVFNVQSDLDFISGPSEITIGGKDTKDYPLTILPKNRGIYSGALMFVAKKTEVAFRGISSNKPSEESLYHIWFQVDCEVDPAPPDQSMSLSCEVFSSKTVQLIINNPSSEIMNLNVVIDGKFLSGSDKLTMKPLQKLSYDVTFTPLSVGESIGRMIFYGSKDGEFWYQLHLEALNPKVVCMPLMECEVGRSCSQIIALNNPLETPVSFTCNNSNTRHYTVTGLAKGQVNVSALSKADIPVLFYPSSIGNEGHTADLAFVSCEFGKQVYSLKGNGLLPSIMDVATVKASISSTTVHVITFVNPLQFSVYLHAFLNGIDSSSFYLLLKQPDNIFLKRGGSVDIPIMFAPEKLCSHEVTVTISAKSANCEGSGRIEHSLCWQYPIYGQPELKLCNDDIGPKIICYAKQREEQIIEVTIVESLKNSKERCFKRLENVSSSNLIDSGRYSYDIKCNDESISVLADQSIGVQLLGEETILQGESNANLVFKVVFAPSKAFRCVCDLSIYNDNGGLWVLPISLHALSAFPDDIITIEAVGLNKEAQVGFRLSSKTINPVPFTAHLADGSDSEITVSPTSGILAPIDSKGTLFIVTYKPAMYGRKHHAKFIVQCDTTEWCYEIIGKLPSYVPPTCHFPMIDKKKT